MNKNHIKTLGSSNHTEQVREINDYYATNSDDVKIFLDKLQQDGIILKNTILEPACGQGHISNVLIAKGHTVQSSDLIDRGYGLELDYLTSPLKSWQGDIITNPPYNQASKFIYRSMDLLENGGLLLLLLPLKLKHDMHCFRVSCQNIFIPIHIESGLVKVVSLTVVMLLHTVGLSGKKVLIKNR